MARQPARTLPDPPSSDILGGNRDGVRARNERTILSLIRREGAMAKADIARALGLSAQTVSVIIRNLEADGLLCRGDPVRGRVGQPSIPMALDPEGAYALGLKIGRRSLDMVLIDLLGQVRHRVRRTHRYPTPDTTVEFARRGAEILTGHLPQDRHGRIAGLGIALPFQLGEWGRAIGAPEGAMAPWQDRDIRADLARDLPYEVYLQNDASAACGAELTFGPRERPRDFLHFYIAYFVGGGVVLDGQLRVGGSGNAGALGSLPIPDPQGRSRQLIDFASLWGLERALIAKGLSADALWGDPESWQVDPELLASWTQDAAWGLAHATVAANAVADTELALIDGWIPIGLRAQLVDAVRAQMRHVPHIGVRLPEICAGTIGADARALGAASLPLSERYFGDLAESAPPLG